MLRVFFIWCDMTTLLSETDTNSMLIQVATLLCGVATTAVVGFISYKMAQLKQESEAAAQETALKVQAVAVALKMANAEQNTKLAAAVGAVAEVKEVLHSTTAHNEEALASHGETLRSIDDKTTMSLKLTNGIMTKQLEITRDALSKLADLQPTDDNVAAYRAANQLVRDHAEQQRMMNQP